MTNINKSLLQPREAPAVDGSTITGRGITGDPLVAHVSGGGVGPGTTNRLAKFTGASAVGDSTIEDTGTDVNVAASDDITLLAGDAITVGGTGSAAINSGGQIALAGASVALSAAGAGPNHDITLTASGNVLANAGFVGLTAAGEVRLTATGVAGQVNLYSDTTISMSANGDIQIDATGVNDMRLNSLGGVMQLQASSFSLVSSNDIIESTPSGAIQLTSGAGPIELNAGQDGEFIAAGLLVMHGIQGVHVQGGATVGLTLATAATDKIGAYGAAPVVRPSVSLSSPTLAADLAAALATIGWITTTA